MKILSLVLSVFLVGCTYSAAVVRDTKPARVAGVGIECAYEKLSSDAWSYGVASIHSGIKSKNIRLSAIGDNAIIAVLDFDSDGALIYFAPTNIFPETYADGVRNALKPCASK